MSKVKGSEKVYHIRMDADILEDIDLWCGNFATLTGAKLGKGEFCRAMIRLGMKEVERRCMEEMENSE